MKKVIRLVSAVGAGASLVWGLARSVARRVRKGDDGDTPAAPQWPPRPSEPMPSAPPPVDTQPEEVSTVEPKSPVDEDTPPAAPASDKPLMLKGIVIDDPAAFLAIVNSADEAAFGDAGVKGKARKLILEQRPFARAEDVGIPGVGRRTIQAICQAAK